MIAVVASVVVGLVVAGVLSATSTYIGLWWPFLVILGMPAAHWGLSTRIFKSPYSELGSRARRPLPDEPPLFRFANRGGRIRWLWFSRPLATWSVYRSGLGLNVFGWGPVFLPFEEITKVWPGGQIQIDRRSPELRGPIFLPASVANVVLEVMEKGESIPPPPSGTSRPARSHVPYLLVILIGIFLAGSTYGWSIERRRVNARQEVLAFLEAAGPDAVVRVMDAAVWKGQDRAELLRALCAMEEPRTHNSHPLGRFDVHLEKGGKRLTLVLARDSSIDTEYWVYIPGRSWISDKKEIARIHTPILHLMFPVDRAKPRRERR